MLPNIFNLVLSMIASSRTDIVTNSPFNVRVIRTYVSFNTSFFGF